MSPTQRSSRRTRATQRRNERQRRRRRAPSRKEQPEQRPEGEGGFLFDDPYWDDAFGSYYDPGLGTCCRIGS